MNKQSEVLDQVFVDENNDFDPDVADSLSYSSEQVCKTGRQDNVEITVLRLSSMVKKTAVTPQIFFLRLSPTAER